MILLTYWLWGVPFYDWEYIGVIYACHYYVLRESLETNIFVCFVWNVSPVTEVGFQGDHGRCYVNGTAGISFLQSGVQNMMDFFTWPIYTPEN